MNESLYNAEVKLLTNYCKPCLDDGTKDKILMFLFKNTLYENALALDLTEDAEQYYTEMLNLLDLRTCVCDINCNTCKNGNCSICK